MPPLGHRKPKPTLSLTEMCAPSVDVIAARKTMFDGWIDECTQAQEALIEGILFQIPSLAER